MLLKWCADFGAVYNGVDIFECPTIHGKFSASIELDYELAAQWRGISPAEWEAMDTLRQAYYIAVYRIQRQISAVQAYEQQKAMERANRPKGGK